MFKKLLTIAIITVTTASLWGCGSTTTKKEDTTKAESTAITSEKSTNSKDFKKVDVTKAGWKMSIDNIQIASDLSNTSEVLGYSSASTSTFEKKADEGMTFVLIKMTIEKDGATENIKWDNMIITDKDGKTYKRIDDSFIDSLKWKRMSGTDLNFGSYEGWFAYEVPDGDSGLVLSYKFENETMEYKLP